MRHVTDSAEIFGICNALGSPVRMEIVNILLKTDYMNLDTLAKKLHLTNGAITPHIKKLDEAGVIKITAASGIRGAQKQCSINEKRLLIDLAPADKPIGKAYSLTPGQYYETVCGGSCGLAGAEALIGENDPRLFNLPDRYNAALVWLSGGHLSYALPLPPAETGDVKELIISAEIFADGGAEISLNNKKLCAFSSPVCARRGLLTPQWWKNPALQYGRLKTLSISGAGTLLDGLKVSGYKPADFLPDAGSPVIKPPVLTFTAPERRTLAIFGKAFGDFAQDLEVRYVY